MQQPNTDSDCISDLLYTSRICVVLIDPLLGLAQLLLTNIGHGLIFLRSYHVQGFSNPRTFQ